MRDKVEYFFATLDFHIADGKSPGEALAAAVEDYAFVYHPVPGDDRTELNRAAERALEHMRGKQC